MKKSLSIVLSFLLIFCVASSASSNFKKPPKEITTTMSLENIVKFGNVYLNITNKELLDSGYEYGDILNVKFLDQNLNLPLCSDYSDVDAGQPGIFARKDDVNTCLAINMGNFASTYNIATKQNFDDSTFKWSYNNEIDSDVVFNIKLEKQGGYYHEYMAHRLEYTNNREDYKELSDAQFANFRMVTTTGIGKGTLYRSSSPINPEKGRNKYADEQLRQAKVNYAINLSDSYEGMLSYEGFNDTYYSTIKCLALNMGIKFDDNEFESKLEEGLKFIANNKGIYVVNCLEGKDRTGFFVAVIESLMGATKDEIIDDYMQSYYNYYKIDKDNPKYNIIANSNIKKTLKKLYGEEDLDKDLHNKAYNYVKSLGLSDKEINLVKNNLSQQH